MIRERKNKHIAHTEMSRFICRVEYAHGEEENGKEKKFRQNFRGDIKINHFFKL